MSAPASDARSRRHVAGTALVLRGDDIDTDRVMPGRFLKGTDYAGLEQHVLADERRAARCAHPFDDPARRGARLLLVDRNFGCGSSREHAPQALKRWGIAAVVGDSFGEIFAGNCLALGVPCVRIAGADAERLREAAAADPARVFALDLEEKTIRSGNLVVAVAIADGARTQLLGGSWDATALLLDAGAAIERTAARLPYFSGWT